jgi:hypothetical protein
MIWLGGVITIAAQMQPTGVLVNSQDGMTLMRPASSSMRAYSAQAAEFAAHRTLLPLGDSITWGCGDTCSPGLKDKCAGGYVALLLGLCPNTRTRLTRVLVPGTVLWFYPTTAAPPLLPTASSE